MNNKVKILSNLAIGIIIFIVTLIIFFLGYSNHLNDSFYWLGLAFILISELAFFGGTTLILAQNYRSNQMLLASGIISTLFIYWIATTILSVFSKFIFNYNVHSFVIAQVVILAVALIVSILLYSAVIKVLDQDTKLMNSRYVMNECESLIFSLKSNVNFSEYSSLLNRIYEEIKYSDKTKSIEKENIIYRKIEELKDILSNSKNELKSEDISKISEEIILLIKERNLSVLKLNQGGF